MHHSTDNLAHPTAFITPVLSGMRNSLMGMTDSWDRSNDPSLHGANVLPESYCDGAMHGCTNTLTQTSPAFYVTKITNPLPMSYNSISIHVKHFCCFPAFRKLSATSPILPSYWYSGHVRYRYKYFYGKNSNFSSKMFKLINTHTCNYMQY